MQFRSLTTKISIAVALVALTGTAGSAQQLSLIPECQSLYGRGSVDQTTKNNLKHIDAVLVDLRLANTRFKQATARFIDACRQLKGDMTQTGPKMDNMVGALHALERAKAPVQEREAALNKDPEETLFNMTSARAVREYRQPACQASIINKTADIVSEARDLLEKSDIDCANPQ